MNKGIRKIPYIKPIWIAAEKFERFFVIIIAFLSRCISKIETRYIHFSNNQSDPRNNEESRPLEWNIGRSLLMIPYCNSHPISISRWCSVEGALEGIDAAKHALKLAPLEARSTLLPHDHPVRHSPHPGSREYRKGSNCCAISLGIVTYVPQCGWIVRVYSPIRELYENVKRINDIFSLYLLSKLIDWYRWIELIYQLL